MTDAHPAEEATLFPKTAGERLREAREAQGVSLAEIAARTRVPVRQLEAIELSNYAALPSVTYSVGFAKAYARAVGLDEVAIAREVRGHSAQTQTPRRAEYEAFTIDEQAARAPGRGLVIGGVVIALLVVIGAALWFGTGLFRETGDGPAVVAPVENSVPEAPAPVAAAPVAPAGAVVLTATDEVWLRVYDTDETLFQGTLKAGERYEVPAAAAAPMINVGRPDQLQVTVGGAPVAALGDGRVAIKDVGISAAALSARGSPQAGPSAISGPAATGPSTRRAAPARDRRSDAPVTGAPLNIAAPVPVAPEPSAPAPGAPAPGATSAP